ncbi:putative protein disulfide-isomerase A6 [Candida maltosa Xu316]|uniref:protein disulfide-isomerase n=1 Tax=Candida maltosa (strain Xu316) TaxID=1245528 RepID=M3J2X3_CANMX|nr:hypothetical protein G210_3522 [Candida maltosa Xu316]
MKFLSLLLYITTTIAYSASNILIGNDQNLQSIIKTPGKFTFVDFYADWCRHCKKLSPTIDQLSELFSDVPEVQIVKINGDKEGKKMGRKYVEIGYPTLLFFYDDGRKVEFDGIRDLTSLSNFIQQLSGIRLEDKPEVVEEDVVIDDEPGNKLVEFTPENFNAKVKSSRFAVASFGASWCKYCKELDPALEQLANDVFARDDILIGHLVIDQYEDHTLDEKYDIQNLPGILFFQNGDLENPLVYKGGKNFKSLLDQINKFTGYNRDYEGNLAANAGVIDEATQLIKEGGDITELYENLDKIPGETIEYYKKLVGAKEYIPSELSRVEDILTNDIDKLNGLTIDSLTKRANILRSLL